MLALKPLTIVRVLSVLFVCMGIATIGVLGLQDLQAQWDAERNISQIQEEYRGIAPAKQSSLMRQARAYNACLAGGKHDASAPPYEQQLALPKEPMMSYIEIPRISLRMPIYHGVDENVLMAGIGHWPCSSLPVGGHGTHCVLLGHSGMRNARMFDDLHRLANGDRISIWTLGKRLSYEVYRKVTVEPDQVITHTKITPGRDLLTLVTCTPYGVNTHRLLVQAKRCPGEGPEGDVSIIAAPNERYSLFICCLALVIATAVGNAISRRTRRPTDRSHAAYVTRS